MLSYETTQILFSSLLVRMLRRERARRLRQEGRGALLLLRAGALGRPVQALHSRLLSTLPEGVWETPPRVHEAASVTGGYDGAVCVRSTGKNFFQVIDCERW